VGWPSLTSAEKAERTAARNRIAELDTELDTELKAGRRAVDLLRKNQSPKSRFAAAEMTVAEGAPIRFALCAICAA